MTVFAARAIGDAEKDAAVSIKLKASVALPGFETKHSAKAVAAYPGVTCAFVDAATCVPPELSFRAPSGASLVITAFHKGGGLLGRATARGVLTVPLDVLKPDEDSTGWLKLSDGGELQLRLRWCRNGAFVPAGAAPAPPARPVVDLLGLDLEPAPAAPAPALPEPAPLLAVPPPAADAPVVAAVRSALDNQAEGKRCAARGDAAGAAAAYRRVVDDLLRAQPLYAASPANQAAVATALPGVDLAALYDEAVAGVRAGERPAPVVPAPVAPAPVVPARPQLRSLASMSRDGHDPFADVELPAAPAPAPVPPPAPVQQPAWAAPPAPAPPVPARAAMPLPTPPAVPAQPKAAPWPAAAALAAPAPAPRPAAVPLPAVPAQPKPPSPPPQPKPVAKPKPPPPPPPKPKPPPPPPRAPEPPSRPARVAHPYDAAEPWQLSAAEGDAVNILETHEDGWADVVTSDGARGMLPVSYLAE